MSLDDLAEPFRSKSRAFVAALQAAHASVAIADTLRRPERAYLMHYAYGIAKKGVDPTTVPAMPGVDVQWVHPDGEGGADLAASIAAAEEMVQGYGIVFEPVLGSRHTEGNAIDMTITWQSDLAITAGDGSTATISTVPRTGAGNSDLHQVGRSYGVVKLLSDAPHWSSDGH
jgi:hypothetical protein